MQDQMIYHHNIQAELEFHKHNVQNGRLQGWWRRSVQFRLFVTHTCAAIRTWRYEGCVWMETFDFYHGWPCFQNMPLEEAEIKEVNETILELGPSVYIMQRIHKWAEIFFQPSWRVQTKFDPEDFERIYEEN